MLGGCEAVISIDTFGGSGYTAALDLPPQIVEAWARRRLEPWGPRVNVFKGESPGVANIFADGIADLVFIDGAHDYRSVMADILAWKPKVRPGGVLAGHDFDTDYDPALVVFESPYDHGPGGVHYGVIRAVKQLLPGFEVIPGTSIWHVTL